MSLVWPLDFLDRVICGDCLEVLKGIPDNSIDLVVTDPPYSMAYVSSHRKSRFSAIHFDELDGDLTWFHDFANQANRVLKNHTHIYIFCNDYAISDYRHMLQYSKFKNKRVLVWVKNDHTAGDLDGDYGNKTEFILFAQKGRRLLNGKRNVNVLNYDRVSELYHPTQKPTSLISFLIKKSSNPGDIVLDPYLGSGTTAVAAKQLGRRYIGIEINPKYCEIAEDRLRQTELAL